MDVPSWLSWFGRSSAIRFARCIFFRYDSDFERLMHSFRKNDYVVDNPMRTSIYRANSTVVLCR